MPMFTISTHETDPSTPVFIDKLQYATARAAIEDAKLALGDTARESLRDRTHAGFHTEVRNGGGKVLYRFSLTFASHTATLDDEMPARPVGESRSDHQD
jgi:CO dehydrogenase/acetyl-CoA synthase gamma subunit (corrinoid Fe-S protein)